MIINTATGIAHERGRLTRIVDQFVAAQGAVMQAGVTGPESWEPVAAYVDPARFRRVGAYLEELNWESYKDFLARWAAGGTHFDMTQFYICEIGDRVFQAIEERHTRGEQFIRKNVIAVYRFDDRQRIVHLDIYEQASDSGRWIIDAATAAMEA